MNDISVWIQVIVTSAFIIGLGIIGYKMHKNKKSIDK